jgi:hypothetical protein
MRAALLTCVVVVACTTKSEPPREHRLVPKAALTGTTPRNMQWCPSAIPNAKTVATPTDDGVDVSITSDDPAARERIVMLAEMHSRQGDPLRAFPQHSGLHGGPGSIGRCPIIHASTNVTYQETPDGVRIHVAAREPRDVLRLQRATQARVQALSLPAS